MLILIQRLFCSPISASLKDGALSRQRSNRLCESVPLNALVLTEPINSETIVREHLVAWSVAGGSGLKCPTPQKRRYRVRREKALVHSGGIPARELVRSTR